MVLSAAGTSGPGAGPRDTHMYELRIYTINPGKAEALHNRFRTATLRLFKKHGVESVAFEMLGPPRLSKLLYESYLLKTCFGTMTSVLKSTPAVLSKKLLAKIKSDKELRARIISIGIPILLPDGKTLLRADNIKIPPYHGENEIKATPDNINRWAHDGWVDLRVANMKIWKERFDGIIRHVATIPANDTSSRYLNNREYWNNFGEIAPGKLAGWIFSYEEKGMRMKA